MTADCVAACVRALLGEASAEPEDEEEPGADGGGAVEDVLVGEPESSLWPQGITGKMLKEVAKVRSGPGRRVCPYCLYVITYRCT